jgi:phage repressor protein C with HTH and peptisase S24 domain
MLETVVQPAGARLGYVEVHQVYDGMMAIKVRGDALAPAVMDGEMLIVEMNTQCAPGDRVLIELVDGSRMCKRLMFERADAITVADMVTSGQMTFEREVVARMSPITAVYSVNRWHR